ncbi:MAG: asparagine synthase (glutamine-hydrolyzing) [Planctomycetaceae bacterium]|nr:asparagine synthase (glutamine-hydrolyzing) [Planctomycetaceae bacterium]
MCGIAGIIDFARTSLDCLRRTEAMVESIRHRGPDSRGTSLLNDGYGCIGATVLSIVDIGHCPQPLHRNVAGRDFWIVFNGEVYNHSELRSVLTRKGYSSLTHCDTEVVLLAYIEYGDECVDLFNGSFAFAVFDSSKKTVFLARDRFGIRPLFFAFDENGAFVFCSEQKGLLAAGVSCQPNLDTIASFFLELNTLTDASPPLKDSFFQEISALPPGTTATVCNARIETKRYYKFQDRIHDRVETSSAACDEIQKTLRLAVRRRIPDEVRFGVCLSGGLDSTAVAALALECMQEPFDCFTISYPGSPNPDADAARQFGAGSTGVRLHLVEPTFQELAAYIPAMVRSMDSPHDSVRQLGMYAMYEQMANLGLKVALVGEGADEFNLGYYFTSPGFSSDLALCDSLGSVANVLKSRWSDVKRLFAPDFLKSIVRSPVDSILEGYPDVGSSALRNVQLWYINRFLRYRLDANDRCAFAHSIEARVPYCDHELAELCVSTNPHWNLSGRTEKGLLRESLKGIIPEVNRRRRKFPMPENADLQFHSHLLDHLEALADQASDLAWQILNRNAVSEMVSQYRAILEILERQGVRSASALTDEILMVDQVRPRIKHVFSILTLLVWIDEYF